MTDATTPPIPPDRNNGPASPFGQASGGGAFPPSPPPPPMQPIYIQMPAQPGSARRIGRKVVGALFVLSILVNVYLISFIAVRARAGKTFTTTTLRDGESKQQVAVYDVAGTIDEQQANGFDAFVREVADDGEVKAVVLRVDSGGGSVSASDQMHQGVLDLKRAGKKVVVSMGGTAASGAYYLSAPADAILAEPTTVTGSIGVIAMMPVIKDALGKIGVETVIIRSTQSERHKASLNPFEAPGPDVRAETKAMLDKVHGIFAGVVAAGRPALSPTEVQDVCDGRIWLGQDAVEKKLVDKIGYLEDAIDEAAKLAQLSKPKAVQYRKRVSLLSGMFDAQAGGLRIDADLLDRLQTPRIMMLWRPE